MGSVIAHWRGRCADEAKQRDLLTKIEELAAISHGYFEEPVEVRRFDEVIEGNIVVDPDVAIAGGMREQDREQFLSAGRVRLEGIEFRLYDGRRMYPGDDRMSFVFASFDGNPQLDGSLVYVEDREECRKYRHEQIAAADRYLTDPHIHLRYYYEEWLDSLVGWIQHWYIPDLYYWRYEESQGFSFFERFDRDYTTRDAFWIYLKHAYRDEVEGKSEEAASIRAIREAMFRNAG